MTFTTDEGVRANIQMGNTGVQILERMIMDLNLDGMLPMDEAAPRATIFQGCHDDPIMRAKVEASGMKEQFGGPKH